jgi:hypothetical protein
MNQNDVWNEKIQNHRKIVQLLSPIEKEVEQSIKVPLKLIDIRRMSKECHGVLSTNGPSKRYCISRLLNNLPLYLIYVQCKTPFPNKFIYMLI